MVEEEIKRVTSKKGKLWFLAEIDGQTWANESENCIAQLLNGEKVKKTNIVSKKGQWQFFETVKNNEKEQEKNGEYGEVTNKDSVIKEKLDDIDTLTEEIRKLL